MKAAQPRECPKCHWTALLVMAALVDFMLSKVYCTHTHTHTHTVNKTGLRNHDFRSSLVA